MLSLESVASGAGSIANEQTRRVPQVLQLASRIAEFIVCVLLVCDLKDLLPVVCPDPDDVRPKLNCGLGDLASC